MIDMYNTLVQVERSELYKFEEALRTVHLKAQQAVSIGEKELEKLERQAVADIKYLKCLSFRLQHNLIKKEVIPLTKPFLFFFEKETGGTRLRRTFINHYNRKTVKSFLEHINAPSIEDLIIQGGDIYPIIVKGDQQYTSCGLPIPITRLSLECDSGLHIFVRLASSSALLSAQNEQDKLIQEVQRLRKDLDNIVDLVSLRRKVFMPAGHVKELKDLSCKRDK
jgi:hypothetical protein